MLGNQITFFPPKTNYGIFIICSSFSNVLQSFQTDYLSFLFCYFSLLQVIKDTSHKSGRGNGLVYSLLFHTNQYKSDLQPWLSLECLFYFNIKMICGKIIRMKNLIVLMGIQYPAAKWVLGCLYSFFASLRKSLEGIIRSNKTTQTSLMP